MATVQADAVKQAAKRLLILCVLLLQVQWIRGLFHPEQDFSTCLLLVPWGILTMGIVVYAGFTLWRLWSRKA
jgi:hypothetical protein